MRCEADLVHDVTWFLLVDGDVYGCLWMVIDVDVYDSGIFFWGGKVGNVNPGSINPQCTNRVATSF
mgnify:CR=1 FL=1